MSTTVKADQTSDILNKYSYKWYVIDNKGHYHVYLLDTAMTNITMGSNTNYSSYYDLNTGSFHKFDSTSALYWVTQGNGNDYPISLNYNGSTWEIEIPHVVTYSTAIYWVFINNNLVASATTTAPSGFPAVNLDSGVSLEEVQQQISSSLNGTTSATTSANNIQTQVTNNYISYSNGDISLLQLQANINNLTQQLENLNNQSGTTLADKVAINNAITQTQLVQDAANKDAIIAEMEEDLTVSSSVSATITGKINQANQVFSQYSEGTTTQTEAVTQINQYITQLTQLITPQTPTADINAINSAINTINGIKDSVTTHSELSPDVSEEQVQSDQEEIEMLNEMMSVMQEQVVENKMEDQRVAGQAGDINSILEPIWNNKYMTYLVGVSGVLILACIVLHTKYRML